MQKNYRLWVVGLSVSAVSSRQQQNITSFRIDEMPSGVSSATNNATEGLKIKDQNKNTTKSALLWPMCEKNGMQKQEIAKDCNIFRR